MEAFCIEHLRTHILANTNTGTGRFFISMVYATGWFGFKDSLSQIQGG